VVTIVHPVLPSAGRLICGPRPDFIAAPRTAGPEPRERSQRVSNRFRDGVKVLLDRGVTTIACLLGDAEMPNELVAAYDTAAVEILRFPIADFGRPSDVEGFAALLDELLLRLEQRETVYVHCYAGIGRTGTVLACLLKRAGATGDPVRLVRAIYDPRARETDEQQRFARAFAP
jgi:protein tyrosine/serine phosphatase